MLQPGTGKVILTASVHELSYTSGAVDSLLGEYIQYFRENKKATDSSKQC